MSDAQECFETDLREKLLLSKNTAGKFVQKNTASGCRTVLRKA